MLHTALQSCELVSLTEWPFTNVIDKLYRERIVGVRNEAMDCDLCVVDHLQDGWVLIGQVDDPVAIAHCVSHAFLTLYGVPLEAGVVGL